MTAAVDRPRAMGCSATNPRRPRSSPVARNLCTPEPRWWRWLTPTASLGFINPATGLRPTRTPGPSAGQRALVGPPTGWRDSTGIAVTVLVRCGSSESRWGGPPESACGRGGRDFEHPTGHHTGDIACGRFVDQRKQFSEEVAPPKQTFARSRQPSSGPGCGLTVQRARPAQRGWRLLPHCVFSDGELAFGGAGHGFALGLRQPTPDAIGLAHR
jgi:hypothetical protein